MEFGGTWDVRCSCLLHPLSNNRLEVHEFSKEEILILKFTSVIELNQPYRVY